MTRWEWPARLRERRRMRAAQRSRLDEQTAADGDLAAARSALSLLDHPSAGQRETGPTVIPFPPTTPDHSGQSSTAIGRARRRAQRGSASPAATNQQEADGQSPDGRPIFVPSELPHLDVDQALGTVVLPIHVSWPTAQLTYDLSLRPERAQFYEIVLSLGSAQDVQSYIDGLLLIDLWDDLTLPAAVREAWEPLVMASVQRAD